MVNGDETLGQQKAGFLIVRVIQDLAPEEGNSRSKVSALVKVPAWEKKSKRPF